MEKQENSNEAAKMRKLRADFHTHTTYCDGKSTPRQMVEAAYRMGLTDLGISGHADFSMYEPGFGMSDDTLAVYKQSWKRSGKNMPENSISILESNWIRWDRCSRRSTPSVPPTAS